MRNLIKLFIVVLALNLGACSSDSGSNATGSGGSGGSTGGSGGSTGGSGGSSSDGGAAPTTIAECVTAGGGDQTVNDCIINLPTTGGQTVTFTPAADYNTCKM